jgi:hypothetical protein
MVPAVALCGGLAVYLIGQVAFRVGYGGSLAKPRVLTVLVLAVLAGVSGQINALTLLSTVSLSFVLLVAYEVVAEREPRRQMLSNDEASWS